MKFSIAAVILAAGQSKRFGRPKQLLTAGGRLILAEVIEATLKAGLAPVILVLGCLADEIEHALGSSQGLAPEERSKIQIAHNPDYATGQASSVKTGLSLLPRGTEGALFIMGDQAGLKVELLEKLIERAGQADRPGVVRPVYGGVPGGPVFWHKRHFHFLMDLKGDVGGRAWLDKLDSRLIARLELPLSCRPHDLDTESDYEEWLRRL